MIALFIILALLHILAFNYYLLGGNIDKALLSLTPVIGVVVFIHHLIMEGRD